QLVEARDRAEEMNRLKSVFLANMSHEFRTPMTSILGFAQTLADTLSDEEHRQYARMIEKSGRRLMDTMNAILELATIEAKRLAVHLQPTSVTHVVKELLQEL